MKKNYILLFTISLLFSCSTTNKSTPLPHLPSSNTSSIVIASILEISDSLSTNHPCSEVPCFAKVKIEKVEKSSSSLIEPFAPKQEGVMRFTFSLNKTDKELFPNLDKRLPGLNKGDRFKANVSQELLIGSNTAQWVAYEYILLH